MTPTEKIRLISARLRGSLPKPKRYVPPRCGTCAVCGKLCGGRDAYCSDECQRASQKRRRIEREGGA